MDFYVILIIVHIFAAILGVGGATFIEIHLNTALKDGQMSSEERKTMGLDVFVTRIGMVAGFLSGLGFILLYYMRGGLFAPSSVLYNPAFWVKMGLFTIILVNAYLLHKHKISLFWGSALSFVSWWYLLVLGIFLTEGVRYGYVGIVGVYMVLLIGGAYGLHALREHSKKKHAEKMMATPQTPSTTPQA